MVFGVGCLGTAIGFRGGRDWFSEPTRLVFRVNALGFQTRRAWLQGQAPREPWLARAALAVPVRAAAAVFSAWILVVDDVVIIVVVGLAAVAPRPARSPPRDRPAPILDDRSRGEPDPRRTFRLC